MALILASRRLGPQAGLVLTVLVLGAAACGGREARQGAPDTLPAAALPGLQMRTSAVGDAALAADVPLTSKQREALIEQVGFEAGREREFFGKSPTFSHVVARTLRFREAAGGAAYVTWLRRNAAAAYGALRSVRPVRLGRDGFVAVPRGCGCHADVPTRIAAWGHGALVATLLASGPGVDDRSFARLATALDRALGAH